MEGHQIDRGGSYVEALAGGGDGVICVLKQSYKNFSATTVDKISYEDHIHDSSTADVSNNLPVLRTKNAAERIVIHVCALV